MSAVLMGLIDEVRVEPATEIPCSKLGHAKPGQRPRHIHKGHLLLVSRGLGERTVRPALLGHGAGADLVQIMLKSPGRRTATMKFVLSKESSMSALSAARSHGETARWCGLRETGHRGEQGQLTETGDRRTAVVT